MDNTVLGRISISQGCPAHPGRCAVCGSSEGRMVDFGLDLDFYGVVYLCEIQCIKEVCNALGYYSPKQVESIKEQFNNLVEAQKELADHNKELQNAVESLSRLRLDLLGDSPDPGSSVLSIPEPVSGEADREDGDPEPESTNKGQRKASRSKSRPTESDDEQGSTSIHHDDSIASFGL